MNGISLLNATFPSQVNQSRYQPKTSVDEAEFKYKALVTEFAYMYLKGKIVLLLGDFV